MNDTELHALARRRVAMKLGFAIHLLVYVLVNGALLLLSLKRGGSLDWHLVRLLGWGLGLAIHGGVTLLSLHGLRERLLDAEVQRLRSRA